MRRPLALIVLAQFLGTSLWFTPNGVVEDLAHSWGMTAVELGRLTGAIQLGFIIGTLAFAISGLADRWRASRIFFASAISGAIANAAFAFAGGLTEGLIWRFLTGICLAGIYPIGMKLVAGWVPERKGYALGWLVGMLTLGTAFPHLVRALSPGWSWQWVVLSSSMLALSGGFLVWRLGDGPHLAATGRFDWGGVLRAFRQPRFRAAAFGYFGHMWELYAVWALAPLLVAVMFDGPADSWLVSLASFLFIGAGAIGCVLGGHLSRRFGSEAIAACALATSGLACLVWPWMGALPAWIIMLFLLFWGLAVVADSPHFSALAAGTAPATAVGSSLAIMNGLGFLITVFALELTAVWWQQMEAGVTWLLVAGPLLGLLAMRPLFGR
jgi:MFS family permease